MPGSSARQLALTLTVGAILVGCSSAGDKPQTLPTLSASARVDASASLSTPPSAAATAASAAGVEAFIKSYYAEINRAIRTGDVSKLATYSTPACPCRRLVASIKEKSTGSSIRGGEFTLRNVAPHDVTPTLAGAQVLYDVEKAEVVKSDGHILETIPAAPNARDDISMVLYGGHWLISNVLILK